MIRNLLAKILFRREDTVVPEPTGFDPAAQASLYHAVVTDATRQMCPFYGCSLVVFGATSSLPEFTPSPHLVINRRSNRCALITSAHSPCVLDIPSWDRCQRNPENNGSYTPTGGAQALRENEQ